MKPPLPDSVLHMEPMDFDAAVKAHVKTENKHEHAALIACYLAWKEYEKRGFSSASALCLCRHAFFTAWFVTIIPLEG